MIVPDLRYLSISAVACVGDYIYAAHALTNIVMKIDIASETVSEIIEIVEEGKDAVTIFGDAIYFDGHIFFFPLKGNGICILDISNTSYEYINIKSLCAEENNYYCGFCNICLDGGIIWLMPRSNMQPVMIFNIASKSVSVSTLLNSEFHKVFGDDEVLFSKDAIQYHDGFFYILDGNKSKFIKLPNNSSDFVIYQLPISEKLRGFYRKDEQFLFYAMESKRVYCWRGDSPNEITMFEYVDMESLENSFIRLTEYGDKIIGLTVGEDKIYELDLFKMLVAVINCGSSLKRSQLLFWSNDLIASNFCCCKLKDERLWVFPCGIDKLLEINPNGNHLSAKSIELERSVLGKVANDYLVRRREEIMRDYPTIENPYINLTEFLHLI